MRPASFYNDACGHISKLCIYSKNYTIIQVVIAIHPHAAHNQPTIPGVPFCQKRLETHEIMCYGVIKHTAHNAGWRKWNCNLRVTLYLLLKFLSVME